MNRIDNLFKIKNNNILSVYYPAGFPKLDSTIPILEQLQENGADMVELGIPFSDPMADGPVIQQAANKALENGMSLRLLFEQIESMRNTVIIPVILMGYLNPIMHYGFEAFCKDCNRVGVDGVIIPDLPFKEYVENYKLTAEKYGIHVIMFITPQTSEERIRMIDESTQGFIYIVSSTGTTGERNSFEGKTDDYFARIKQMQLTHPQLIGFGISNKQTYTSACRNANGAIIGSHFVKLLEKNSTTQQAVKQLIIDLK